MPPGAPPTQLESKDLIVGTGPAAKPGDKVTVQYVGVAYSSKQQFDASWDRGQPLQFVLGEGQVIKGWDEGVVGMQVGGRRELIIPGLRGELAGRRHRPQRHPDLHRGPVEDQLT